MLGTTKGFVDWEITLSVKARQSFGILLSTWHVFNLHVKQERVKSQYFCTMEYYGHHEREIFFSIYENKRVEKKFKFTRIKLYNSELNKNILIEQT